MPECFDSSQSRSTFAQKMEYRIKQNEAVDMCQRIISAIIGKYLEELIGSKDKLEISVIQPHKRKSGKKIIIETTEGSDTMFKFMPLSTRKHNINDMWEFIAAFLPDYYHRNDVLHEDILSRYLNNEEVSEGDLEWIYRDYGPDRDKVAAAVDQMDKKLAYEALGCWLETHGPETW